MRKKLIEVALPLDAINTAAAREKSIRHGHPSTLHLWWARRPLAAARAVIFSQMVDDPSEYVDVLLSDSAAKRAAQRALKKRLAAGRVAATGHAQAGMGEMPAGRAVGGPSGPADRQALGDMAAALERERLASGLRRARRSPACRGTVRPAYAARVPRPVRRRRRSAARSAAAGSGSARQRSESGSGADQQGDDRDPAEVRRPSAGEPGFTKRTDGRRADVVRGSGAGRGRAPLRPMDARGGGETDRTSLSTGRDHTGGGAGTSRSEAVRGPEADGHRVAVGADGEEPEPGLRGRSPSRKATSTPTAAGRSPGSTSTASRKATTATQRRSRRPRTRA